MFDQAMSRHNNTHIHTEQTHKQMYTCTRNINTSKGDEDRKGNNIDTVSFFKFNIV